MTDTDLGRCTQPITQQERGQAASPARSNGSSEPRDESATPATGRSPISSLPSGGSTSYTTRSGQQTLRYPVELERAELKELAELYHSLFVNADDPTATGLRKIATVWAMESGERRE